MVRVALAALGATFGWWLGILMGSTVGGALNWFVSPVLGRMIGGLLAGLIGAAIEARFMSSLRGKRLQFTGATALVTAVATLLLIDVHALPWLVGGVFGAAIAVAQAKVLGLGSRDAILRTLSSSVAWSLGFALLQHGGAYEKLGVLAPGLAVILFALSGAPTRSRMPGTTRPRLQLR